ncbi:MAG: sodium:proton antiporter, partial [Alistipes sp.]
MRKVLSFSLFLMLGLVASQLLPGLLGSDYAAFKFGSDTLLYICLAFIMINVGREFEIDKTRWKSYTQDYFIAMASAALPWILIALYYVFVLLPPEYWGSSAAWKENLLLSRFAAPTSAGILFTMLAAMHLSKSWIYKKIQVLAIFDDLDTILLMIPLQIMMIGLRWQMIAVI